MQVRDVPHLKLATGDFYVKAGVAVATVGFPMGDMPLTVLGKVNQMTPFLRRGIVSSVFPFAISQPHGFTIDIMQQGGSSGSPIFREEEPVVVGMMASSVLDVVHAEGDGVSLRLTQNTNMSIAVPAARIQSALASFERKHPWSTEGMPTLEEWLRNRPMKEEMPWKPFGFSRL